MAATILVGLYKHRIPVDNIYIVQINGNNRLKDINEVLINNTNLEFTLNSTSKTFSDYTELTQSLMTTSDRKFTYKLIQYPRYEYHKQIECKIPELNWLDWTFESKAHEWMINNINYKNDSTLFWIIGSYNNFKRLK
jgi:hypothetical protein